MPPLDWEAVVRSFRLVVVGAWLAGALALAHCGGGDPEADDSVRLPGRVPGEGGEGGDDGGGDGGPAAACDPNAPFGAPALVAGLDPAAFAATPRLSADELTIYFTTLVPVDGSLVADLAKASRGSREAPFGPATALASFNSPAHDNDPMVASDNLSLWFSSSRSDNQELYVARRASTAEDFGPALLVPGVGGPASDMHPYYRVAGQELWLTSDRSDAGFDIYLAREQGAGFSAPALVPELSSEAFDMQPAVTEDGLTVVFASNRDGGAGGYDLWLARRNTVAAPFAAPAPIAEIGSSADEYAGWLSPDGCRIYFSSGRGAATDAGELHRLYVASRPR